MVTAQRQTILRLVAAHEQALVQDWVAALKADGVLQSGRVKEAELQQQCLSFLRAFVPALEAGITDIHASLFAPMRELLTQLAQIRAQQGFSSADTALLVFALKQPLFGLFQKNAQAEPTQVLEASWASALLLDRLGLFTIEAYQKSRDELIARQQQEISELSTPVIKLWNGILALPLIGTLDSQRTQVVMENLLESIVAQGAEMAIIDITGVPTVDTLTAQHLLKTVAAARLMGADCIISGIRPQIAQTMVHLGVELTVISKASLADAFALALTKQGRSVQKINKSAGARSAIAAD